MNTTDQVHFFSADTPPRQPPRRELCTPSRHELRERVRQSVLCAREYLCSEQRVDGSWAGSTTGEVTALSHVVLWHAFRGREHVEFVAQAARGILRQQRNDGGWATAAGEAIDLDASVLAYFALKLAGEDACGVEMAGARRAIRARGGADACSEATRRWLALLGQIDYELCAPAMPEWLLASCLSQDATSRELLELAARAVVWALRPRREVELARGVRELFIEPPRCWAAAECGTRYVADRFNQIWKRCERAGLVPFRRRALERASFLLAEATAESADVELKCEDLAWQWIALTTLGFRDSCRTIQACERRLNSLIAVDEEADEARSQPHTTLSADTALAVTSLLASGLSSSEAVTAAGIRWMVEHRLIGRVANARTPEMTHLLRALTAGEASCTEAETSLPPALRVRDEIAWADIGPAMPEALPSATIQQFIDRLVSGLSVEQRTDGGWCGEESPGRQRASGINHAFGRRIGDSGAELTGAVLQCITAGHVCVRAVCERAIACLRSIQHGDGKWESTTHARYIYGTACAVQGLISAGIGADDPLVARGVNWLLVHQDESGGWGETRGCGDEFAATEATAIQTAWAVLALLATGNADHEATRRGVNFLVESQRESGGWCDETLVERDAHDGPWYQNELHSTSYALLALARWVLAVAEDGAESTTKLRLVCGDATR